MLFLFHSYVRHVAKQENWKGKVTKLENGDVNKSGNANGNGKNGKNANGKNMNGKNMNGKNANGSVSIKKRFIVRKLPMTMLCPSANGVEGNILLHQNLIHFLIIAHWCPVNSFLRFF